MLLQNLFLGCQAPLGELAQKWGEEGAEWWQLCCTGGYFIPEVSSPLSPLPAAHCRHGENGKGKKENKEMQHLPSSPGMIPMP